MSRGKSKLLLVVGSRVFVSRGGGKKEVLEGTRHRSLIWCCPTGSDASCDLVRGSLTLYAERMSSSCSVEGFECCDGDFFFFFSIAGFRWSVFKRDSRIEGMCLPSKASLRNVARIGGRGGLAVPNLLNS